ncbi:arf-GAP domain and FG repeat-containing protein 1a isoform X1 [Hemibagrus wyckioides]|uniref:arf-GAP domain and FG repeat-containing protein 1a isoform X1 n=1 Tax=Hemibagrus wyckioides TaxID=337641 RepID=UPI00266D7EB3|nr:arf-GAP domain and FG repeat-containing protein 1a isoform X1 [Hemibagrus wyckioides]
MAASAKRKQEEKHLKMLREMTSLAHNRKCFDCDQRGPTYANMTNGSFVCTSCSGILRGLNPPHRVKSISMTTFTQQEIEFLQKHGNEVCKQIWLGLYDDRSSAVPDFREPQKVKEFLQEKYEKKRWYVPPDQAKVVASVHASMSGSSASSTNSTPEVRPLKTLLGDQAPALHLSRNTPSQSPVASRVQLTHQDRKFDLLSDLGGDIFSAPASQSSGNSGFANFANFNSHPAAQNANSSTDFANFDAFGSSAAAAATTAPSAAFPSAPQAPFQPAQTAFSDLPVSCSVGEFPSTLPLLATQSGSAGLANANFANFDNFPKSCSADFATYGSAQSNCSGGGVKADGSAVPADRYAALADLDNIFSSGKTEQGSSSAPPSAGVGPPPPQVAMLGGDRYAALAALDTAFSAPAPSNSSFGTATNTQGPVFGAPPGVTAPQPQQAALPQGFGGPSTNPFVSSAAPPSNPFQANGRPTAASFGPGSMSMPAGFSNTAAYNLPTSFSGNFQQAFPGQGFPQPQAYTQQPNGSGGFAAFGQGKAAVAQFGQNMAAPGVTNNPFLAGAPVAQFPAGGSSTNPFL